MLNKYDIQVDGAKTTLIKTNKFKTVSVIVSFLGSFTKENCTLRSMLTRVIANTCSLFPTKSSLARYAFSLYDTSVYATYNATYNTSITNFVLDTIHDKYTLDKNVLQEAFNLLHEIIFNPHIINNGFGEMIFQEEKRSLKDALNSVYNNKGRYAYKRLLENMAPNEVLSIFPLGYIDELEKITPQSLYQFYLEMLNNEEVRINIIGDLEPIQVENYFQDFHFNKNKVELKTFVLNKNNKEVKHIKEYQDIRQAKLMMGFRNDITHDSPLYAPLLVFNAMFGGMFGSTLFSVIREENSLAYDVSSDIMVDNGVMVVSAGIDSNKENIVIDLIIKEFEKYKQGIIDENLIKLAKDFLINDLNEIDDNPYSILIFNLKNSLRTKKTLEEILELIKSVTKEDIIEVSNHFYLDTIFALKAGEENE